MHSHSNNEEQMKEGKEGYIRIFVGRKEKGENKNIFKKLQNGHEEQEMSMVSVSKNQHSHCSLPYK